MDARRPAGPYPIVFHDGRWVDKSDATVQVASQAMRYGLSVFEGVRLYRRVAGPRLHPFLLGEHLERLRGSLTLMRMGDVGLTRVPQLVDELVERNDIADDAYVRIAVSAANPGLIGDPVVPLLTISGVRMGRKRWLESNDGMRLQISTWERASEAVFPPAAKNVSAYAGPRLALLAARDAGYDGCVLTNRDGRLCEAPTAALFLVHDGVLRTPALSEGVLPSITRQWVLNVASQAGLPTEETKLGPTDAYQADEAFLCGTGIEFAPVQSFDGRPCRAWPRADLTRAMVRRYFQDAREPAATGDRPELVDD